MISALQNFLTLHHYFERCNCVYCACGQWVWASGSVWPGGGALTGSSAGGSGGSAALLRGGVWLSAGKAHIHLYEPRQTQLRKPVSFTSSSKSKEIRLHLNKGFKLVIWSIKFLHFNKLPHLHQKVMWHEYGFVRFMEPIKGSWCWGKIWDGRKN